MKKKRINIEHTLRCKNANIIWPLLSTEAGLQKWIADTVERDGDILSFTWGEVWSHHEIRQARVVAEELSKRIRFVWEPDEDEEAYWELCMERSDITGDYVLVITDYALPEDEESLYDIWGQNLEQLHQSTGL